MVVVDIITCTVMVLLSIARSTSCRNLPKISRPLPVLLYDQVPGDGYTDATRSLPDGMLTYQFPGQFFSQDQIGQIEMLEISRVRREVDMDLCCPTDVWFGTVPDELMDVDGEGPWQILRGEEVSQAYSRGDCHDAQPNISRRCPAGGECKQKTRLHLLWVQTQDGAELKYFRVNSHCSYEPAGS